METEVEQYNNENEKFIRGTQQRISTGRRKYE